MNPAEQTAFETVLRAITEKNNKPVQQSGFMKWWPILAFLIPVTFSITISWVKMENNQSNLSSEITRGDSLARNLANQKIQALMYEMEIDAEKINYNMDLVKENFIELDLKYNFIPLK